MAVDRELRVFAKSANWWRSIDLMVESQDHEYYGQQVVMKKVDDRASVVWEPTFSISMTAAQELMDNLWQCGLRPSEGTGSAGAMAATQAHLKDMQQHSQQLLDYVLGADAR